LRAIKSRYGLLMGQRMSQRARIALEMVAGAEL
jgi:hypothetical protein